MNQETRDYLSFRRMVTPAIIQTLFWIMIGLVALSGIIGFFASVWTMFTKSFGAGLGALILNIIWLVVLSVLIRIYCELVILFFRMSETLTDIKDSLRSQLSVPDAEPGAAPNGGPAAPVENSSAPGGPPSVS